MNQILVGDGTWPWLHVEETGEDILVVACAATFFGGDDDPQDDGTTASGIDTKGNPDLMGCALPMSSHIAATQGSPIPKIPWQTEVRVWCHETHKIITVPVIDLGPNKRTRHGLDLTEAAFEALGVSLSRGVCHVDYRILGGAQFVKSE